MAEEKDWNAIEPERTAMRVLVAKIDVELAKLGDLEPVVRAVALADLKSTWSTLVGEAALGREPLLRECPACRHSIRHEATRCRYCLERSPAGAAVGAASAVPAGSH